jgi:predicted nucleic acid-binding protein
MWIAANTMECGAILITRNQHFAYIENLRLGQNPADIMP